MKPLVSVVVVTFNSENTIQETLDSILRQDYGSKNIDIIISDDCSLDNTISVVEQWISTHSLEFHDAKIIKNEVNMGVSVNCNNAWKNVKTEWVKSIGGDDLLLDNCITQNVNFVKMNSNCFILASKMEWFGRISKITPEYCDFAFFNLEPLEQFRYLRFNSFNFAPSVFMKKELLEKVGYADIKYRNLEDLPLWLKITRSGYKIYFLNEITVKYRISDSISKHSSRYVNLSFLKDLIDIDSQFKFLEMRKISDMLYKIDSVILLYGKLYTSKVCGNKIGLLSKILDLLIIVLRPVNLYRRFRRYITNKNYKLN